MDLCTQPALPGYDKGALPCFCQSNLPFLLLLIVAFRKFAMIKYIRYVRISSVLFLLFWRHFNCLVIEETLIWPLRS